VGKIPHVRLGRYVRFRREFLRGSRSLSVAAKSLGQHSRRPLSGALDPDAGASEVDPHDRELSLPPRLVTEQHSELALGGLPPDVELNDTLELAVEEAVEEHGEESNASARPCLLSDWGMPWPPPRAITVT